MTNGKAQKTNVGEISGGQMAALMAGVAIEMPRVGDLEVVKKMIANTKRMKPILRQLVTPKDEVALAGEQALQAWHAGWPRFWRAFGFKYDHDALVLPEYRQDFGWSIVMPDLAEWPMSKLLHGVCERMFPIWQYYDNGQLDKIVSAKEPTGAHVVLVRNCVEADEIHKNKSANMVEAEKILAITLRQRAVLEARYFFETNEHLDIANLTICAGSRYTGGSVPRAGWGGDEFGVRSVDPDLQRDHWRVREVVSLP